MKKLGRPIVLIITGTVIGILTYFAILEIVYSSIQTRMLESNFLSQTFEKDPSLSGAIQSEERLSKMKEGQNPVLTWRILSAANVIDDDLSTVDVSKRISDHFNKTISNSNDIRNSNSLDVLIELLQSIGKSSNGTDSIAKRQIKQYIVAVLSEKKNALKAYDDYLRSAPGGETYNEISNSSVGVNHAVLNRLFYHYGAEKVFSEVPNAISNSTLEPQEEYNQIKDLCFQILLSVSDDLEVKSAVQIKEWIKGIEQVVMICLFFVAIIILIIKSKFANKLNLDEKTTRSYYNYYNWIFSSLTAIGFIGTIRGLSNALSDADIIFRSGSGLDQAISISSITGVLGVAFSTTLIALVLTLLLSLAKLAIDPTNQLKLD
ncbi:MotA/TolQ/ExbB proton channel family protein [uncultured Dokdonia sp.]|uniref:MotA/TolQ/ExbB proton channel family protein n=1 Tax=uncultured Dokdonia sp. TaxID=575653 RepID=UPI002608CB8B|nr:MotA/TolQ/ExbB proton channel family protein [uncultured Dokdonia sp.]